MKDELAITRKLCDSARRMTESIVSHDAASVAALVEESAALQLRAASLAQQREKAAEALAEALGLPGPHTPPLRALLQALPAADSAPLASLARDIRHSHSDLRARVDRNQALLNTALEYVEFSLNAITGAALKPVAYGTSIPALRPPAFYVDQRA